MTVDGLWDMTITSPMGDREARLDLKSDGTALTGTMSTTTGPVEIADGIIDGDQLSWSARLTSPLKVTLKATATVDGDTMTGKAKAGILPSGTFTGKRISSPAD